MVKFFNNCVISMSQPNPIIFIRLELQRCSYNTLIAFKLSFSFISLQVQSSNQIRIRIKILGDKLSIDLIYAILVSVKVLTQCQYGDYIIHKIFLFTFVLVQTCPNLVRLQCLIILIHIGSLDQARFLGINCPTIISLTTFCCQYLRNPYMA